MKNSESIKKMEDQVNKLEKNIMEILNQLEKEEKEEKRKKKNKMKKEKNKINGNLNNNKDISIVGDISINVPKIIYKDLSISKDDL